MSNLLGTLITIALLALLYPVLTSRVFSFKTALILTNVILSAGFIIGYTLL